MHARARARSCVCVCVLVHTLHTLHAFLHKKQLDSPNYLAVSQDRIQNRQIERSCVGPSQSCNAHKDRYKDVCARVKDRYTEECVCVCARARVCAQGGKISQQASSIHMSCIHTEHVYVHTNNEYSSTRIYIHYILNTNGYI